MRVLGLALVGLLVVAGAGRPAAKSKPLSGGMNAADRKATGIDKLTADEQMKLYRWWIKIIDATRLLSSPEIKADDLAAIRETPNANFLLSLLETIGPKIPRECGLGKLSVKDITVLGLVVQRYGEAQREQGVGGAQQSPATNREHSVYVYKQMEPGGLICVFVGSTPGLAERNARIYVDMHREKYGQELTISATPF